MPACLSTYPSALPACIFLVYLPVCFIACLSVYPLVSSASVKACLQVSLFLSACLSTSQSPAVYVCLILSLIYCMPSTDYPNLPACLSTDQSYLAAFLSDISAFMPVYCTCTSPSALSAYRYTFQFDLLHVCLPVILLCKHAVHLSVRSACIPAYLSVRAACMPMQLSVRTACMPACLHSLINQHACLPVSLLCLHAWSRLSLLYLHTYKHAVLLSVRTACMPAYLLSLIYPACLSTRQSTLLACLVPSKSTLPAYLCACQSVLSAMLFY